MIMPVCMRPMHDELLIWMAVKAVTGKWLFVAYRLWKTVPDRKNRTAAVGKDILVSTG